MKLFIRFIAQIVIITTLPLSLHAQNVQTTPDLSQPEREQQTPAPEVTSSITECKSIADFSATIPMLTKDDLVLFDFDNTLCEPVSEEQIGSDQWFCASIKYLNQIDPTNAFDRVLTAYSKYHFDLAMQPVEDSTTTAVFKKIQASGCQTLILTARSIIEQTFRQIKSLDFNFTTSAPSTRMLLFDLMADPVLYKQGFLFCSRNNKGTALFTFLDAIGYTPKTVYFFDDRKENVEAVQKACDERKIPFKGLHYTFLQEKVRTYKLNSHTLDQFIPNNTTIPVAG